MHKHKLHTCQHVAEDKECCDQCKYMRFIPKVNSTLGEKFNRFIANINNITFADSVHDDVLKTFIGAAR